MDLDDPLAGILSDGSDDSFFDDDILGKKKPAKKKATPIAERKSSLFDFEDPDKLKSSANISESKKDALFDLGGDSKKIPEIKTAKAVSPAPLKRSISKESFKTAPNEPKSKTFDTTKSPAKARVSASADKLNILNELGSDKKEFSKPLEKGKSSQSILDDILGGSSTKTGGSSQATRPTTAGKSQDFDFDSFLGKTESKSTKNVPQKPNAKIETAKEDKKTKQENPAKKKSSDDWLGIFQEKDEVDKESDTEMPSWLVGAESKKKKEEKRPKQEVPKEPRVEVLKLEEETPEERDKESQPMNNPQIVDQFLPKAVTPSVFQGSTEDITAEGATLYLQQQESQLMVAMQLKAQEERLAAMQTRQKESQRVQREAALAQHSQLDAMLQRQAEQRRQMQAIISSHQQRISQRIKSLLGINTEKEDNFNPNDDFEANDTEEKETRETPHAKEKKQLLQLVQSLQENHDKEIDLMESSYRRQLAFLEVSLNQGEERMKEESDKLIKFYTEKIQWLEDHHQQYKNITEGNLNSLTERHKAENEMIRQQHLENIRILQEHHANLMENIKNAVKQEQALVQDSASFSSDLHQLVRDVKDNKEQFQQLVEKVQTLTENNQMNNERSLQVRETQINDMIQQLKKERENFDTEKVENREIVKLLESRLKQMTAMIEEESAALKQKKMEFEFEKATFSKKTEFAKNILKKQDEEIKALRDDIQKEYQEKTARIEEEKAKAQKDSAIIAKEKASMQSLKQDIEKMKAELEAQLEEVTEERSKLNVEKQQLHLEEQRVLAKSRDYDLLAKTAIDKQSQADKKYSEAEFLQRKYEERIRRIQEHVVSLNAREKQIAREKVALSRERLSLHNEKKQMDNKQQCSLCRSQNPDYNIPYLPDTVFNVPISRDYRNVDTAMNNIERDIASLMSRNYSLRHDTDVGTSGVSDAKFQSAETAQVDSEPFKDLMDPKFMMLRLDVQKVLSNLDHKKDDKNNIMNINDENFDDIDQTNQDK